MSIDLEARYQALQMAQSHGEPADKIIERAAAYLAFLNGHGAGDGERSVNEQPDADVAEARRAMEEWHLETTDPSQVRIIAWAIARGRNLAGGALP